MAPKTVLLIDGNPLCWRSSHVFKDLKSSYGKDTGVVFGSLLNLEKVIRHYEPYAYYVLFDEGKCRWRGEFHTGYKSSRKKEREEIDYESFYREMQVFKDILIHLGIKVIKSWGVEADDLMGLMVDLLLQDEDINIVIVGGDRDLWQLISERVICFDPISKKETTLSDFNEKFQGINPDQLIEIKALTGDSGDDIPGIKGIGETTALKLLLEYGSLENIFKEENRKSLDNHFRTRGLLDKKEIVDKAKVLVSILRLNNLKAIGKLSVLTENEAKTIYESIIAKPEFNRTKFVELAEGYELKSIAHRLPEFLDMLVTKNDPLMKLAPIFKKKILGVENELKDVFYELDIEILSCNKCLLRKECTQPVVAQGFEDCNIMLVGRNPGKTEDKKGIPFTGIAGKRLDKFLESCGIKRDNCWVTNCCKCYSLDNRAPKEEEILACSSFLRREIDLLNPKLIIAFGSEAMFLLTGYGDSVMKRSGTILHAPVGKIGPISCTVLVMVHPSFVIRNPIVGEPLFQKGEEVVREYFRNS